MLDWLCGMDKGWIERALLMGALQNCNDNWLLADKILRKIGEGTFGRVLDCWDREARECVAIKVVRSIRKYRDAAMIEVDILQHLVKNDRRASRYGIDMHDLRLIHTDLKPENILLVSAEYVKIPGYKRSSQDDTNFRCLPKSSAIKLIDFGSTVFGNQDHSSIVSTRHYRAPEILFLLYLDLDCICSVLLT
ncbi:hypothetical protein ACLOJK_019858 [Asimina triloba]